MAARPRSTAFQGCLCSDLLALSRSSELRSMNCLDCWERHNKTISDLSLEQKYCICFLHFSLASASLHQYLTGEEKRGLSWGQEMERPQGGGMERVSLITLLQEDEKTQRDRKRQWIVNIIYCIYCEDRKCIKIHTVMWTKNWMELRKSPLNS